MAMLSLLLEASVDCPNMTWRDLKAVVVLGQCAFQCQNALLPSWQSSMKEDYPPVVLLWKLDCFNCWELKLII